jgi:hypothetical protein
MLTMDSITRLNRKSLEAGLIWAVILHVARQTLLIILNLPEGQPVQQTISGGLFFVAFLAYPMLLNAIMQVKTPCCWRNPMVHATAGSVLALLGILLISTLGSGMWLEAGMTGLTIWLLLAAMLPWISASKFLKQEGSRNRKQWERLDHLTLTQMMFLQIPTPKR